MKPIKENKDCPCPDSECPRHGKCDECSSYHLLKGGLSCCKRPKEE